MAAKGKFTTTITNQLRDRLEQSGMSQAEIARRIGVAHTTVGRWLSGEYDLSQKRINEIGALVGLRLGLVAA